MRHEPYHTLDNFYTHKGNEVAFLAAKKIAELPGVVFNPFYIYGAEGLGKTHLLRAINRELSKRFTTLFLSVKAFEKMLGEDTAFDSPLIVDDIQKIRDDCKDRLLDVVERAVDDNIQICFAADVAPQSIRNFSPKLCSLIESGLVCDLQPPDQAARIEIIKKKADDVGIILPDDVAEALAQPETASIRTIGHMVNRLVTYSSLGNLPSDADGVKSMLEELSLHKKTCTIPSILEKMKKEDLWKLTSTQGTELTNEYERKKRIWEVRGFDVSFLNEQESGDETQLKEAYQAYVEKVRDLITAQSAFQVIDREQDLMAAMNIQSMLFDPEKIDSIRKMLTQFDVHAEGEKEYRKFSDFLLGACNNEAWHTYHDQVLESLGMHNPCFVFGAKGTGKTHFLEAICDDLLSRGKAVLFHDLASDGTLGNLDDVVRYSVLVLDNFHTIADDPKRISEIRQLIDKFMHEGKQIFVGSAPLSEKLPDQMKGVVDIGLSVQLEKPSADIVIEYIRKYKPVEADEIAQLGIPEFDSFYELEYYLASLSERESMIVPLGLPGEDMVGQSEESAVKEYVISSGGFLEKPVPESDSLDYADEENYMFPDVPSEFIEEKF